MEGSPREGYSPEEDSGHGHVGPMQHERLPSPVPSCVSMKSDQSKASGLNFERGDVPTGQSPMQHERLPSPVPSCVSMKSDQSKASGLNFERGDVPTGQSPMQHERLPSPVPSCVSMKSDQSKASGLNFERGDVPTGQSPMQHERLPSPVPSCVSMKSDQSKASGLNFERGDVPTGQSPMQHERLPSPVPSCVSMKSDQSKASGLNFERGDVPTGQSPMQHERLPSPVPSCVSMKSDQSKASGLNFERGDVPTGQSPMQHERLPSPVPSCVSMKSDQSKASGLNFERGDVPTGQSPMQHERLPSPVPSCVSLKSDESKASGLNSQSFISGPLEMQQAHKSHLLKRFQCLMEGLTQQGNSTLLRKIYTDLYITQGGREEVNNEHEVRQIERASWREAQDRPIKCSDIFKQLSEQVDQLSKQDKPSSKQAKQMPKQVKPIRIVLTKGVAGIGKTVSVQKFILDWAEGESNQDVDFIFPLPFRELNLMKEKTISLINLIRHFFSDVRDAKVFTSLQNRVMFIFDGLDECRLPLDFHSNPECCDVTESVPMDVLLTNLIKGKLLPSALLWITTRPAAANQIPHNYVNQVTEIRGFNDLQKEEYFVKKLCDESLASRTIAHLKSSRSLYIMCHIPVFGWISATVVERTSDGSGSVDMPRTLAQMYTHFLIIQVRMKNTKYTELEERDEEMIFKLGKLAFQQLERGNLIFYEGDLRECGIDVTEASVYSGVCTQIFREEAGLFREKVFSFVHLSIQEFLAALYVFLCFISRERNMPDQQHQQQTSQRFALFRQGKTRKRKTSQLSALFRAATLHDLHKTAVALASQSKNGHLDLFLRFLLGLSLESNQSLLRHLLPQTTSQSQSSEKTVQLVKQKIQDTKESNRRINLFYCLNELNQHAVVEHIDRSSGTLTVEMLLPGQWKTVKFGFKTSGVYLDGFDLQKYMKTPEMDQTDLLSPDDVIQKLSELFTPSTSAELESGPLSEKSCSLLYSALVSNSSGLTKLTLKGPSPSSSSPSSLRVSSLTRPAVCHADCKPWELSVTEGCDLTEEICSHLVSALTSHTSTLFGKGLKKEEVERLCSTLSHQDCRLERTELEYCPLSEKSYSHLVSALTSHSSRLTWLKLKDVFLPDASFAEKLRALQNEPHYQMKISCEPAAGRSERSLYLSCIVLGRDTNSTVNKSATGQ